MNKPTTAMVLAAGFGKRLMPLTAKTPKPLIQVGGKPIIDYGLDKLSAAGVDAVVVNVHYLADQIKTHMAERTTPRVMISEEPDGPLETGGGTQRALPQLGPDPFFLINGDSFFIDGAEPNFDRMITVWNPDRMDLLLLLSSTVDAVGYHGQGDFNMDPEGLLQRRNEGQTTGFVYAGAAIINPAIFAGKHEANYSLNLLFDEAIARDRLFGMRLDGVWMHISTPPDVALAETIMSSGPS